MHVNGTYGRFTSTPPAFTHPGMSAGGFDWGGDIDNEGTGAYP